MSKLKSNVGATLVELLLTIVVGSPVTMAAITVLIFGLQAHRLGTDTTIRLNEVQMGLSAIRELLSENTIAGIGENGEVLIPDGTDKEGNPQYKALLYYDAENDVVFGITGARILEDVTAYTALWDTEKNPNLVTVTVKLGSGKQYTVPAYCRVVELPEEETTAPTDGETPEEPNQEGGGSTFSMRGNLSAEEILAEVLRDQTIQPSIRVFVSKLASQLGSTGRILTEDGLGDYYSQWYIGSFEENPDWNAETPWCACYVSWALAECGLYLEDTPARFANVDKFWVELVTADAWKSNNPKTGDLIFFDWVEDGQYNPQHVGVVLTQRDGLIYTIEGNTNGVVAIRKYAADDAGVMGYGILDWK